MMHAFLDRAIWNSSRTMRAPSPTYFCTSSLPAAGHDNGYPKQKSLGNVHLELEEARYRMDHESTL
jgi:hypothetical protein